MTALLLTIAALIPPPALTDVCDVVEVNHLHDCNCDLVFSQAIFWDETERGEQVVAWRIIRNGQPMPVKESTGYVCRWNDKDGLRVVTAKRRRITYTHTDPELQARHNFPQALRRGLTE